MDSFSGQLFCLAVSSSYVCSLYLIPVEIRALPRDNVDHVRYRLIASGLSTALSLCFTWALGYHVRANNFELFSMCLDSWLLISFLYWLSDWFFLPFCGFDPLSHVYFLPRSPSLPFRSHSNRTIDCSCDWYLDKIDPWYQLERTASGAGKGWISFAASEIPISIVNSFFVFKLFDLDIWLLPLSFFITEI